RGTVMWQKIGYCRQKAAECAARAQEAADKDTRALFLRFRDSWLSAANRYESSPAPAPDQTPQWRPSPPPPQPRTHEGRGRPDDARRHATAERLGAAGSSTSLNATNRLLSRCGRAPAAGRFG